MQDFWDLLQLQQDTVPLLEAPPTPAVLFCFISLRGEAVCGVALSPDFANVSYSIFQGKAGVLPVLLASEDGHDNGWKSTSETPT